MSEVPGVAFDPVEWVASPYHPTPTIIEAARALYANHTVEAIASSEAGENLRSTASHIESILASTERRRQKAIVFVTGVPGAGSERYGLVASSAAERLKPHAVDVRVKVDPVHWFLHDHSDTRSSFYLEDAATEFVVQGLELDWVCVMWDADLRYRKSGWSHHEFRGTRWRNVKKADRQSYLQNAYRVLLTRARQGMVICIPEGSLDDSTRAPEFYDETYKYLSSLGIASIS